MSIRIIDIRIAIESDSRDIWSWRNDFSTRANSLNQEFIPWDSHQKWFREMLRDKINFVYIGEIREEKIGMCRFSLQEDSKHFEASINLNPQFRGQQLSKKFLEGCINELFSIEGIPHSLVATIKETNLPSMKLFKSLGFGLVESKNGVATFVHQT